MDWERDDISSPLIRKIHPTQKPVKLLERLIEIFTDEGDVIIDPVAGSGSTLIAAANKNRKAYGFEIKKDFYKQAKEWEDDILNYHKEIKEFGFAKSLIKKSTLSLWD
jgi:site-specific DNA-methyltransferase (adenine-specific)